MKGYMLVKRDYHSSPIKEEIKISSDYADLKNEWVEKVKETCNDYDLDEEAVLGKDSEYLEPQDIAYEGFDKISLDNGKCLDYIYIEQYTFQIIEFEI